MSTFTVVGPTPETPCAHCIHWPGHVADNPAMSECCWCFEPFPTTRCEARSPESDSQCDLVAGHSLKMGHESRRGAASIVSWAPTDDERAAAGGSPPTTRTAPADTQRQFSWTTAHGDMVSLRTFDADTVHLHINERDGDHAFAVVDGAALHELVAALASPGLRHLIDTARTYAQEHKRGRWSSATFQATWTLADAAVAFGRSREEPTR